MAARLGSIDQLDQNGNKKLSHDDVESLGLRPSDLDDQYYILSEDNPFHATLTRNGQLKWDSQEPVNATQVAKVMRFTRDNGRFLHINTGTHGDEHGNTVEQDAALAEANFSKEDLLSAWECPDVSVHIVSQGAPKLEGKDYKNVDIIDAWCFSAKSNSVVQKVEDLRKFLSAVHEHLSKQSSKTPAYATTMGSINIVKATGNHNVMVTGVNAKKDVNVTMKVTK